MGPPGPPQRWPLADSWLPRQVRILTGTEPLHHDKVAGPRRGGTPLGLCGVCDKIGTSRSAPRKSGSHCFARNFWLVGTEGCHTASKLQPSAMTERLRKCLRVRPCELANAVFPLFGDVCTKSATEAELQRVRRKCEERGQMRPRDPVLLFVAQLSSPKKVKRTSQPARKYKLTEVENNPILRSCEDEPRQAPTQLEHVPRRRRHGPASAEPSRHNHGKKTGRVHRRDARNNETAAAMTPTVKDRHETSASRSRCNETACPC